MEKKQLQQFKNLKRPRTSPFFLNGLPSFHKKFNYKNAEDLREEIQKLKLSLKMNISQDILKIYSDKIKIGNIIVPNRIVIHPMEGCDGKKNGKPGPLTFRRYKKFAKSGAGIVWFEATAIAEEGRANPRQLLLNKENKEDFKKLLNVFDTNAKNAANKREISKLNEGEMDIKEIKRPIRILQLTHSGRYSRQEHNKPQRMYNYPVLDYAYHQDPTEGKILNDYEIELIINKYVEAAKIAYSIGFDGVDIKSCHRYLLSESLSAYTRTNSKFGGEEYEKRTMLIKEIIQRISTELGKKALENFIIAVRLNVFDGIPYPFGWGVYNNPAQDGDPLKFTNKKSPPMPDLQEPIRLLKELYDLGVNLVNITIGNPYFNAFVSRPYDIPLTGLTKPPEHPLYGVSRFIEITRAIRKNVPKKLKLVGTGYSWLRQFGPYIGAEELLNGNVDLIGWGRMAFAYPEFPLSILNGSGISPKKTCITCSKCTEMMRKKTVTGCVIRDYKIYAPIYNGKIDYDEKEIEKIIEKEEG